MWKPISFKEYSKLLSGLSLTAGGKTLSGSTFTEHGKGGVSQIRQEQIAVDRYRGSVMCLYFSFAPSGQHTNTGVNHA